MRHGRSILAGLVVLACLGAAGCRGDSQEPSAASREAAAATVPADPDAPPARPRIVAFGDSLTIGLGLLEQEAYPALLQRKIDEAGYKFEVVNAGVSGDTSAGGLRRLDWALEGDVKVLIVAFGGNDGLRGLPGGPDEREPLRDHRPGPRAQHRRHSRRHGGAAELRAGIRDRVPAGVPRRGARTSGCSSFRFCSTTWPASRS